MMLLGRGGVAAALGLGLALSTACAMGQAHKPKGHVVQPDDGSPPEQAVQPEPAAQYEHANDPEPPPAPEPPAEAQPEPSQPQAQQNTLPPAVEPSEPESAPAPATAAVHEAPAPVVTPAGTGVQNQLQKDTAALLQLAQDLKTEIEKAGSNTMSLVAIRKADEIQKLSRNLRERIRIQEQVPVIK